MKQLLEFQRRISLFDGIYPVEVDIEETRRGFAPTRVFWLVPTALQEYYVE